MNREEKLKMMVENYIRKRDQSNAPSVMEFHRKHLFLFMNRFCQFIAHFKTPSSSLLSHEIFLVVEAVTIVAKSDWAKCENVYEDGCESFPKYFAAFDELASGLAPLDTTAAQCLEALGGATK